MATYAELFEISKSGPLRERTAVAVAIAADTIRSDPSPPVNQANRLAWAKEALADPLTAAKGMLPGVLALNKDNTVNQIENASDADLQTAVDTYVDIFAGL